MDERDVGQLAETLFHGYLGYAGATAIVRHPYTNDVIQRLEAGNSGPAAVPIEKITRRDGSAHAFSLTYAIRSIVTGVDYQAVHDQLWLSGALLTLGDALQSASYFDKGPDLEFLRHLRNAVGHGNRFHFSANEPRRRARFTGPDQREMPDGTHTPPGEANTFEITSNLQGSKALFDFVGPGDICDLLLLVSNRLIRIGNGDPPRELWPQL